MRLLINVSSVFLSLEVNYVCLINSRKINFPSESTVENASRTVWTQTKTEQIIWKMFSCGVFFLSQKEKASSIEKRAGKMFVGKILRAGKVYKMRDFLFLSDSYRAQKGNSFLRYCDRKRAEAYEATNCKVVNEHVLLLIR